MTPFDAAEFTRESRELVAQNDRVPTQREPSFPEWMSEHEAEVRAAVERLRAEHPVESCDLFRTVMGRCTCR